jgi:hypothetical protein
MVDIVGQFKALRNFGKAVVSPRARWMIGKRLSQVKRMVHVTCSRQQCKQKFQEVSQYAVIGSHDKRRPSSASKIIA